jgi:arylformamidase
MDQVSDIEREYNARLTVAGHEKISDAWAAESEAYRSVADCDLDIPYGAGERNRFDLFRGKRADGSEPVLAYIHGGYWRSRDRSVFSHIARAFNPLGLTVAIPSYNLCPDVGIGDIVAELRDFIAWLWQTTGRRCVVAGHSAGGHLTAALYATDWRDHKGVPEDMVRAAFAMSGLYDLRPLCDISVNDDLNLTPEAALALSPALSTPPLPERDFVAVVGGAESSAFRWQTRLIADNWAKAGVNTDYIEVEGANHFTVVNMLTAPESPLGARLVALAQSGG